MPDLPALADWTLAWPWLLVAIPLPWLLALLRHGRRRGAPLAQALKAPFAQELQALERGSGRAGRAARLPWLALLAWAALCLAAARPQQLGAATQPPQTGRDLLLAVDLSGSMAEQDMVLGRQYVDRLTAVKAVLNDFLERRVGDRVGLLLFGAKAYAVTPLTLDRSAVLEQLLDSEVGIAGQETAIGEAVALGVKRLAEHPDLSAHDGGQRVLILLTDGVNTAGEIDPVKGTELAVSAKVRVHTIGFGSERGARGGMMGLPFNRGSGIDEDTLARIAEQTGGRYFRARDTTELAGIYAELDRIEPAPRPGERERPRLERYAWPLAAALLFALLGGLPWARRQALPA